MSNAPGLVRLEPTKTLNDFLSKEGAAKRNRAAFRSYLLMTAAVRKEGADGSR